MPKVMTYVPDDLKAEMDAVKDLNPSWSAVAQEAFRFEVQRLQNRKEGASKMDAAIERLRVSKARAQNSDQVEGENHGRIWAMGRAEYDELERLATFAESEESNDSGDLWFRMASVVLNEETLTERGAIEFWNGQLGYWDDGRSQLKMPSDAYVQAFIDGAIAVFEDVDSKL